MLFFLRMKTQTVYMFQYIAQAITTLKPVFYLAEDFTDFIFDGIRTFSFLFKAFLIREEFPVNIVNQILAR